MGAGRGGKGRQRCGAPGSFCLHTSASVARRGHGAALSVAYASSVLPWKSNLTE